MKRTQIYLSTELDAILTELSNSSGLTKSQLIREALEQAYFTTPSRHQVLHALQASAGTWKRRESGAAYVERLRRGRLARLHAAEHAE